MYSAERRSLEGRLAVYAATKAYGVAYENVAYTPVPGTIWLACMVVASPNPNYSTIGAVRWVRKHQIFQININIPNGQGAKTVELIAEDLQAIFTGQIKDGEGPTITFYPAALKFVGSREGFFTAVLSVSYQVDFPESAVTPTGYTYTPPDNGLISTASTVELIAANNISAFMVVRSTDGEVDIASNDLPMDQCRVLGVCLGSALAGAIALIQFEGVLSYNGWAWNLNDPIYLGLNGVLTQVAPTAGFSQRIGMPLTANSMIIEIDEPIIL